MRGAEWEENRITSINGCQAGVAVARAMPGLQQVANVSSRSEHERAHTKAVTGPRASAPVCPLDCGPACASGQTSCNLWTLTNVSVVTNLINNLICIDAGENHCNI